MSKWVYQKMSRDKQLVGAAGEYLVLSRLLNLGFLASPAPRGVRKADILVNHLDGTKLPYLIQVKTRTGLDADSGWHMGEKNESIKDKDLFYCFVALGEIESNIYVIPAEVVARVITESHSIWLNTPGSKGQKHNETSMRKITNFNKMKVESAPNGWMNKYLEKWNQLK